MSTYDELNSGEQVARYQALTEAFEIVVVEAAVSRAPEDLLAAAMAILALRDDLDDKPAARIAVDLGANAGDRLVNLLRKTIRARGGNVQHVLGSDV